MDKIRIWKPISNMQGEYYLEDFFSADGNDNFVYKKFGQENIKIHIVCEYGAACLNIPMNRIHLIGDL